MGRRSRTRAQGAAVPARAADRKAAQRTGGRRPGRSGLDPVRKALAGYLLRALALAVVTFAGILVLGGRLGPLILLAGVVVTAGLVQRAATGRLAGQALGNEDRVIQTMAGGMLVLCVLLALAGAVVAALA